MKKFDEKTKTMQVIFNTYKGVTNHCPECGRPFTEQNTKFFNENNWIRCPKCGAKLEK